MSKVIVPWDLITNFVTDAFIGYGIPAEDAKICTDVLLESDRRGIESHGCNRFKPIYLDRIKAGIQNPVTRFEILKETPTTAVVDGHNGMGQVIGHRAMQMAIDKAKEYGMGMVAVRNSCHYGIAGYYATMATKAGCIGITGTNARPSVAPTFGVEGMFGTNPLTVGIPTDEDFDFLIDCATSITQNGKIEYYARIGEDVHPGTVIGRDGQPISGDSGEALKKIRRRGTDHPGRHWRSPGRLQRLRLRHGDRAALCRAARRCLRQRSGRQGRERQHSPLSPGPLLHCH